LGFFSSFLSSLASSSKPPPPYSSSSSDEIFKDDPLEVGLFGCDCSSVLLKDLSDFDEESLDRLLDASARLPFLFFSILPPLPPSLTPPDEIVLSNLLLVADPEELFDL